MSTIDELVKILEKSDGPVTRDFLQQELKLLKSPPPDPTETESETDGTNDQPPNDELAFDRMTEISVLHVLCSEKGTVGLLKKPYPTDGEPFWARFSQLMAKDSVLLLSARMGDLPALADKLDCWGFSQIDRILMLTSPGGPDVTGIEAIAICQRGKPLVDSLDHWPTEQNPIELAEKIVRRQTGRKVRLFAQAPSNQDGWEDIVGDANLSTADLKK